MENRTLNRVLVYHKIDSRLEFGITRVSPKQFEKQIKAIISRGFKPVTLADLFSKTVNGEKKIAITFDDGYKDIYDFALPVMNKFKIPGTVFIIASSIGKDNRWDANLGGIKFPHLNEDEIRELLATGWEIGSHSLTHRNLAGATKDVLRAEIADSKILLEKTFNTEVKYFCVPFGKLSRKVREMAVQAGYSGICGFYPFRFRSGKITKTEIPRLAVYSIDTPESVLKKIGDNKPGWFQTARQNWINFFANGTLIVKTLK